VPARKKQPTEAEAPVAPRQKKTAATEKSKTEVTRKRKPAAAAEEGNGAGKPDLVIGESPTKAKTINKYLGSNFVVRASYGHVRDLPKKGKKGEVVAGVNIEAGWVPTYVVQTKEEKGGKGASKFKRKTPKEILADLKREAAKCNRVFLATDPDREGEAIAWQSRTNWA